MSSVSPRRSYCDWASPVTLGLGLCLGLRLGFCLGFQLGFCLSFRPGFISFAVWELNEVKVNPVNKGRGSLKLAPGALSWRVYVV